jgi:acyl-coenzyme A thioesterase PaaI-like protein
MSLTITEMQQRLEATRKAAHFDCVSCGDSGHSGLGLKFNVREDRGVEAEFPCGQAYQGYRGLLHGGVTSMLLDAAMTNCLFAHGRIAFTARLIVRFLLPIQTERNAIVRAWIREFEPPLYVLEAEVAQHGDVLVRASAKFIDRSASRIESLQHSGDEPDRPSCSSNADGFCARADGV